MTLAEGYLMRDGRPRPTLLKAAKELIRKLDEWQQDPDYTVPAEAEDLREAIEAEERVS